LPIYLNIIANYNNFFAAPYFYYLQYGHKNLFHSQEFNINIHLLTIFPNLTISNYRNNVANICDRMLLMWSLLISLNVFTQLNLQGLH